MTKKVGVLVVDDSPICRQLIADALAKDPEFQIVGMAENGREALELAQSLKPNVITMDVDMPVMGGLEAVEHIMAENPIPILMLTADPRQQAPELTCRALELGALALQVKPALDAGPESWNLAREVKLLSKVKVIRHLRGGAAARKAPVLSTSKPPSSPEMAALVGSSVGVVAIVSSTGGPQVIHRMVSQLPADFPAPIVLVQHINAAFAESLAGWLQSVSKLQIRLAKDGDMLVPGQLLVAPPGLHLTVPSRGKVGLLQGEPHEGHLPSGTLLLETAAKSYGRRALGVILTGMGTDGAAGMAAVKAAGGRTVAQNQESSVVFGMPGAAISKGVVDHVISGDDLAETLIAITRGSAPAAVAR